MGRLNDAVDRTLGRIHVIQSVVGADRVGVCRCPGAVARTRERNARSARTALYLTSKSRASTQGQDEGGYRDRNSESCDESARHRQVPPPAEVGLAIGFRHESGDRFEWDAVPWNSPKAPATPPWGHHAPADGICRGFPRNVVSRCTDPTHARSVRAGTTTTRASTLASNRRPRWFDGNVLRTTGLDAQKRQSWGMISAAIRSICSISLPIGHTRTRCMPASR